MADKWSVSRGDERFGPYAWEDVVRYAKDGHIAATDLLWSDSTGTWQPASTFPDLFTAPPPPVVSPAPPPPVPSTAVTPLSPASLPVAAPGLAQFPSVPRTRPRWLPIAGVALALLAVAVVAVLLTRDGRGQDRATDRGFAIDEGLAPVLAEAVPVMVPNTPGESVALEAGGSLFFPEGTLPAGTVVTSYLAEPPVMPEGATAVGDTREIIVDPLPPSPVLLRLPIPEGVADPSRLAILRVHDSGYSEFLMTEVQGSDLVAYTPGFSRFTIAELAGISPVTLIGRSTLIPGERAAYYAARDPVISPPGSRLRALWTVDDAVTLVSSNADGATIPAGAAPGGA
ncbi:MAG: DUF4339 domain-containing protein, partial [Anaerolineae bacterium]